MLSLKPHSSRIASICCSVGCLPAIRTAGSPFGITLKMRNVITETANSTKTIETSRRTTKRAIGASSVVDLDLRARVERVADAVAEDVQREHREHQHRPGHDRQIGGGDDPVDALAIIVPQDGFGGLTPAPRNESAASSRIAFATRSGKKTRIVEAMFGSDLARA